MTAQFIVLEALDGVGKTTLARGLAERLAGVAMNTPGDRLRPVTGDVLAGLGDHQAARALFYASSVLARGREARGMVEAGTTVVMDRYWLSTIAYARARGVTADLRCIEAMVQPPDLTVVLALDESERQWRLRERGCTTADRETLTPGFREAVWREFHRSDRRGALRPAVTLDLTGLRRREALDTLYQLVVQHQL